MNMSPSLTLEYLPAVVSSVELNDLICILQRGPDGGCLSLRLTDRGEELHRIFSCQSRGAAAARPILFTAPSLSLCPPFLGFRPRANWRAVCSSVWRENCTVIVVGCWLAAEVGGRERVICKNPFLSSVLLLYLSLSFAPFFIVGHILQLQPLLSQGLSRVGWDLFQAFLVVVKSSSQLTSQLAVS